MPDPAPTRNENSTKANIDRLARQAGHMTRRMAATTDTLLPTLFYVTDTQTASQLAKTISTLPQGSGVILRHYADKSRAQLAHDLATLCQRKKLKLLIAGTPALAQRVRAFGIHLPEHLIPRARHIRHIYPMLKITAAVHSRSAMRAAIANQVDAVLISPVFSTRSHPNAKALGPLRLAMLSAEARALNPYIARIALGGLNADNAARLTPTGITGLAGISMFEN